MTNTEEMNIAILKSKRTKREIAKELGISEMGLYKKINGLTEFKASEISKMKELLNLSVSELNNIFFNIRVE